MRRRARVAMELVALLWAASGCVSGRSSTTPPSTDELAAMEFVGEWCAAIARNDVDALDGILAEGYVLTSSTGRISSRSDALDAARARSVHYARLDSRDMKARVYGDTAVVTGRIVLEGVRADGARVDAEVAFTDTLARIDGRWKGVAAHVSKLSAR